MLKDWTVHRPKPNTWMNTLELSEFVSAMASKDAMTPRVGGDASHTGSSCFGPRDRKLSPRSRMTRATCMKYFG